jgi:hypothetical protein
MKRLLIIVFIFSCTLVEAQTRLLEITNNHTGKVRVIEENQRVKLRGTDRRKIVGKLSFADGETLVVDNVAINIDSLQSIKKQPKVLGTVKTVVLVTGLALVGSSIVVATGGNNVAFLLFAGGAGVTVTAGVLESLNANYTSRKWTYKILEK